MFPLNLPNLLTLMRILLVPVVVVALLDAEGPAFAARRHIVPDWLGNRAPLGDGRVRAAGLGLEVTAELVPEVRSLDEKLETALSRAVKKAAYRIWERRPVVETTVLRV